MDNANWDEVYNVALRLCVEKQQEAAYWYAKARDIKSAKLRRARAQDRAAQAAQMATKIQAALSGGNRG